MAQNKFSIEIFLCKSKDFLRKFKSYMNFSRNTKNFASWFLNSLDLQTGFKKPAMLPCSLFKQAFENKTFSHNLWRQIVEVFDKFASLMQ